MRLNKKFSNVIVCMDLKGHPRQKDLCEEIADDFAIGFAEWFKEYQWNGLDYSVRQLLEIYKIQKGL